MNRPRGTKRGYINPSTEVPEDGIFNPMDYIDVADYRTNRRGMMQYEEDLAQIQYLAQMRQQQFALDYQDPQNDVQRQRSAGLNPDLLGLSGASAPVGPTAEGVDMSKFPTNTDQALKGIQIVQTVTQMTKDMLSGGLQLQGNFLGNMSKEADLMSSLMNLQDSALSRFLSPDQIPLSGRLRRRMNRLPVPQRHQGKVNYGAESDYYDNAKSFLEKRADFWRHEQNGYYNVNDENGDGLFTSADWAEVWKPLADIDARLIKKELMAKESKVDNQFDYESYSEDGKSLGDIRGESEFSSKRNQDAETDFQSALRDPLRKVAEKLKEKSDEGNSWATFALIALYFVVNISGSISKSSGSKGSSTSFGLGF